MSAGGRDAVQRRRSSRPCPICGKPSTRSDDPFCSERCRDRDLNRWLSGGYAIPSVEEDRAEPDSEDVGDE